MPLDIQTHSGAEIKPLLEELAALRIAVFKEYPYLYDGSLSYETRYLESYIQSSQSIVVSVRDAGKLVGATTALPLMDANPDFQAPFNAYNINPNQVFYYGESVVLRAYRGQGLGRAFFAKREAFASALNQQGSSFTTLAFCAVLRATTDLRRPIHYRDLAPFWCKQGFAPQPALICQFPWLEIGQNDETQQLLMFWTKSFT